MSRKSGTLFGPKMKQFEIGRKWNRWEGVARCKMLSCILTGDSRKQPHLSRRKKQGFDGNLHKNFEYQKMPLFEALVFWESFLKFPPPSLLLRTKFCPPPPPPPPWGEIRIRIPSIATMISTPLLLPITVSRYAPLNDGPDF